MINLTLFAALLLTLRLIAFGFFGYVLYQQHKVLKKQIRDLTLVRRILFYFGLTLLLANVVPIVIDIAALSGEYVRQPVASLGVMYAFSNATFAAISGAAWFYLYRTVERERIQMLRKVDTVE
jgi:membrane associated rhomboid family serine protease